jgi:hypothetical protein
MVRESLLENLRAAGYAAVDSNGGGRELVIASTIIKLDCDMYMAYNAAVNLSVSLKRDKQIIFSKSYGGTATAAVLFVTPGEYQAVLTNAMRQCVNAMMPELLEKLKQVKDTVPQPLPEAIPSSTNTIDPF